MENIAKLALPATFLLEMEQHYAVLIEDQAGEPQRREFVSLQAGETTGDLVGKAAGDNLCPVTGSVKTGTMPDRNLEITADMIIQTETLNSFGMKYIFVNLAPKPPDPLESEEAPVPSALSVLMKANKCYDHLPPSRYVMIFITLNVI